MLVIVTPKYLTESVLNGKLPIYFGPYKDLRMRNSAGLDLLRLYWSLFMFYSKSCGAPLAQSRSTFFFTLPVEVFGSSFTISTSRGIINPLIPLSYFAHLITSSPVVFFPGLMVTYAFGLSPQCESETATTAASRISECVTSIPSSATDEIFSPPGDRYWAIYFMGKS